MSGKTQSDYLEKRFGRNRQLSGANYFASERQFIEAEKAIRVPHKVFEIMKSDDNEQENVLLLHSETIMDGISEVTDNELSCMDSAIIFYVAGFNARSVKNVQISWAEMKKL